MKYFNFPISILNRPLNRTNLVFEDIIHFALYEIGRDYHGTKSEKIKYAMSVLDIKNAKTSDFNLGRDLAYEHSSSARTGISHSMLWEFYKNEEKTKLDLICLRAFLALKSIIGNKIFAKTNYELMFSRIIGRNAINLEFMDSDIWSFYSKRRQREKIINNLQDNWHLKYYSYYTRGFYVSFNLERKQLIEKAEKSKASTKKKMRQIEAVEIRNKILFKI